MVDVLGLTHAELKFEGLALICEAAMKVRYRRCYRPMASLAGSVQSNLNPATALGMNIKRPNSTFGGVWLCCLTWHGETWVSWRSFTFIHALVQDHKCYCPNSQHVRQGTSVSYQRQVHTAGLQCYKRSCCLESADEWGSLGTYSVNFVTARCSGIERVGVDLATAGMEFVGLEYGEAPI